MAKTAADLKQAEKQMQYKIYERTMCKAKRNSLGMAYSLFTDGMEFPQIDGANFEYAVNTRLNLGWGPDMCERMFQHFDRDRDGIISFDEFNKYMMPKDVAGDQSTGVDGEGFNTILGYHSKRRENPRRPRQSRLIAARAKGMDLPPVPQPPQPKLPTRQSNFNPINPEPAFDIVGAGFTHVPSGWTQDRPFSQAPGAPGRDPRRRKMD